MDTMEVASKRAEWKKAKEAKVFFYFDKGKEQNVVLTIVQTVLCAELI